MTKLTRAVRWAYSNMFTMFLGPMTTLMQNQTISYQVQQVMKQADTMNMVFKRLR